MTFEQIVGLSLALLVMFIGLAGTILPGLPSTPLVLAAAVGHRLYFGPAGVSNFALVILALLTLCSLLVDYLASMFGAKKLGATWRGALGAVVGALIGLFFALPGIILGPFLGALIFEMAGGREFNEAARAGMGALLGLLAGAVGKLACCFAMMALFTFSVVSRSGNPPDTQSVELIPSLGPLPIRSHPIPSDGERERLPVCPMSNHRLVSARGIFRSSPSPGLTGRAGVRPLLTFCAQWADEPERGDPGILAAAGWNGAMCFVVGRFRWVEPAAARMAALRGSWEGDSLL